MEPKERIQINRDHIINYNRNYPNMPRPLRSLQLLAQTNKHYELTTELMIKVLAEMECYQEACPVDCEDLYNKDRAECVECDAGKLIKMLSGGN